MNKVSKVRKVPSESSKVRKDSRTYTIIKILELLDKGNYPEQIAKRINKSKSTVNYYLNLLKAENLIKIKGRHETLGIELTAKGKEQVRMFYIGGMARPKSDDTPLFRLHNLEVEYAILKPIDIELKEKWDLGKWCGFKERIGDVTVRYNPSTQKLIFYLEAWGSSPENAFAESITKVNWVINELKVRYPQLMMTPYPKINRKMHMSVPTPDSIKEVADRVQISADGWKIDKSEGDGEFEVVNKDPFQLVNDANAFVNGSMANGKVISEIQEQLKQISKMMMGTQTTLNALANSMLMQTLILKKLSEK